ncbi:MAG TPA: serine/threonine protein phosphatase [Sediminispirochaeta sp.]|nr:serine/threonine protein phosphatase [Sediminispirochaeta sp.]
MFEPVGESARIEKGSFTRILVFGDLHGDLEALKRGLSQRSSQDLLIFLGDYADRGPQGVEVIEGLLDLQQRIPEKLILLMGNHEDYDSEGRPSFMPCTLIDEAESKRGGWFSFFPVFRRFQESLYLSALLPGGALFVHGGIGSEIGNLEMLSEPDAALRTQLLWGDPADGEGESPSPRGAGRLFGPDISQTVLGALGMRYLIRSHEPRKAYAGPMVEHQGRVVTTSSTRVYGGRAFVLVLEAQQLCDGTVDWQASTAFLD